MSDESGPPLSAEQLLQRYAAGQRDFHTAKLHRAVLRDADLREVDLRGADLILADLCHADLSGANLGGAALHGAYLHRADLRGADLRGAYLSSADLSGANLHRANLSGADLSHADLSGADLRGAALGSKERSHGSAAKQRIGAGGAVARAARGTNLSHANLQGADLRGANLRNANLAGCNLSRASLSLVDLHGTDLTGCNFSHTDLNCTSFDRAVIGGSVFAGVDLSTVAGLQSLSHTGPSTLGTDTLALSRGQLPAEFLRGCGLTDADVLHAQLHDRNLSLVELARTQAEFQLLARRPRQVRPVFLSSQHDDAPFVDAIELRLQAQGLRYWRDVHGETEHAGQPGELGLHPEPTLLLVLSEHSVAGDWLQARVEEAHRLGERRKQHVLCPLALDSSWQTCSWPESLRDCIHGVAVHDFSDWRDADALEKKWRTLLDGLALVAERTPAAASAEPA